MNKISRLPMILTAVALLLGALPARAGHDVPWYMYPPYDQQPASEKDSDLDVLVDSLLAKAGFDFERCALIDALLGDDSLQCFGLDASAGPTATISLKGSSFKLVKAPFSFHRGDGTLQTGVLTTLIHKGRAGAESQVSMEDLMAARERTRRARGR